MSSPSLTGGSLFCDEIIGLSLEMTQCLGILEFLVYKRKKHLGILEFIFGILDLSLRILEFILGILEFYLEILDLF